MFCARVAYTPSGTHTHSPAFTASHIKVCACNYVISFARIHQTGPDASARADNCLFNWIELIAGRAQSVKRFNSHLMDGKNGIGVASIWHPRSAEVDKSSALISFAQQINKKWNKKPTIGGGSGAN